MPGSRPGLLTGIVLDAIKGTPADGATVQLYSASDSVFRRRQLTDAKGNFTIEDLTFGLYRLSISYTGYGQLLLDSIHIRAERFDFDLCDLKLQKTDVELSSIIVYAEKPLIENYARCSRMAEHLLPGKILPAEKNMSQRVWRVYFFTCIQGKCQCRLYAKQICRFIKAVV